MSRVFFERADHCEQNCYQSNKVFFHVWSQTSAPKDEEWEGRAARTLVTLTQGKFNVFSRIQGALK